MATPPGHGRDPLPVLTLFTDDHRLAALAGAAGVDRIGPDLEVLGKETRQAAGYRRSEHDVDRIASLRSTVRPGGLFARTNPPHDRTPDEVERLVTSGVDVLMLPMFSTPDEVERFCAAVADRATVVLLVENQQAVACIDELLDIAGVDEVHVGLNDLALSLGIGNRFALLASPVVEAIAAKVEAAGLPFGVGGIARLDRRDLPVPPDLVYAALARLRATRTILARTFVHDVEDAADLAEHVRAARERYADWTDASDDDRRQARDQLADCAR